jgi:DNA-binding MarR family transcriptional regulator
MSSEVIENQTQIEFLEAYQLAAIGHRASSNIAGFFSDGFDLQVPDWRILVLLTGVDFMSFKDVVEHTGMEKSRVSRAHLRLQKAGLVLVSKGPFDNRTLVMKLTAKGENICQAALPKVRERNNWLLDPLTDAEKKMLAGILKKLSARVRELE